MITKSTRRFIKSSSVIQAQGTLVAPLDGGTLQISDTANTAAVTGNMRVVWAHIYSTLGDAACLYIETQANTEQTNIATLLHWHWLCTFQMGAIFGKRRQIFFKRSIFQTEE